MSANRADHMAKTKKKIRGMRARSNSPDDSASVNSKFKPVISTNSSRLAMNKMSNSSSYKSHADYLIEIGKQIDKKKL